MKFGFDFDIFCIYLVFTQSRTFSYEATKLGKGKHTDSLTSKPS